MTRRNTTDGSGLSGRLIFGFVLIGLGVIFALEQSGLIANAQDVLRFWPALLLGIGLWRILWPGPHASRLWGLVVASVGCLLLLSELDLLDISLSTLWPVVLILVGGRLVWKGMYGGSKVSPGDASRVDSIAVMAGSARTCNSPTFRGGNLVAFMGACEVDLREARIGDHPAVIDVFAMWGGIEITVPRDWSVTMGGVPLLGALEDKTSGEATEGQELIINGLVTMGGVEVKN